MAILFTQDPDTNILTPVGSSNRLYVATQSEAFTRIYGKARLQNVSPTTILVAPGAGLKIVVTSVFASNVHATVGTATHVREGATDKLVGYSAALGGNFYAYDREGLFEMSENTAVTVINSVTGSDVHINVSGFIREV